MALKIALLTIHSANNYGAVLQTFATLKALSKYGEVSVLDYQDPHTSKSMSLIRFGTKPRDVLRMGKDIFRLIPRYKVIKKFRNFSNENFNLTIPLRTDNDFNKLENEFDVFVSGSDQIWNPKIVTEKGITNTRYYLDFVTKKKKISYASSLGSHTYSEAEAEQLVPLLNSYDSLAVREENSAIYLPELLQRNVSHVLDPTLLHTKKEWLDFFDIDTNLDKESYILVYALKKDKLLKKVVEQVKQKLDIKVITIDQDPFTNFKCEQHIRDASPEEFIDLFSKASFIVTNSFHGTCFSVNFNIPFIVTTPQSSINRIESLLKAVDLDGRITIGENLTALINKKIDFDTTNTNLNKLRSFSYRYLLNAMTKKV